MRFSVAIITVISFCLVSCENDIATKLSQDLCYTGTRPMTAVATQKINGSYIAGDVTNLAVIESSKYASALAKTKKPFVPKYSQRVSVAPVCGPYGCVPVAVPYTAREDVDLREVYGLARVPVRSGDSTTQALEDAKTLAIDNCDAFARDFAEREGLRYSSYRMQCVITNSGYCSF